MEYSCGWCNAGCCRNMDLGIISEKDLIIYSHANEIYVYESAKHASEANNIGIHIFEITADTSSSKRYRAALIGRCGHLVGNHCNIHDNLPKPCEDFMVGEIDCRNSFILDLEVL